WWVKSGPSACAADTQHHPLFLRKKEFSAMRISKLAMAAALSLLILGRNVVAQQPSAMESRTKVVNYSLSDETPASFASYSADGDTCACEADSGDCCDGCGPCCYPLADLGEADKLFDGCFFQEREIVAGGYIAQSFIFNPYDPVDRFNGPTTWTDRSNDYQMNEIYMF